MLHINLSRTLKRGIHYSVMSGAHIDVQFHTVHHVRHTPYKNAKVGKLKVLTMFPMHFFKIHVNTFLYFLSLFYLFFYFIHFVFYFHLIVFYFILSYFILFHFILFFHIILFYFILFHFILFLSLLIYLFTILFYLGVGVPGGWPAQMNLKLRVRLPDRVIYATIIIWLLYDQFWGRNTINHRITKHTDTNTCATLYDSSCEVQSWPWGDWMSHLNTGAADWGV